MGGSLIQFVWTVGSSPVPAATLTLADSQASIGDPIVAAICRISAAQSSGTHMEDELEMDMPQVSGFCSVTGVITFTMIANPATGPLYGNYLVAYAKTAALQAQDTNFAQVFLLMGG